MLDDKPPRSGEHSRKRCVRDQLPSHYTTCANTKVLTGCGSICICVRTRLHERLRMRCRNPSAFPLELLMSPGCAIERWFVASVYHTKQPEMEGK